MNCVRCNTTNEDNAKFCRTCGLDLTSAVAPVAKDNTDKQGLFLVLILMGWECLVGLIWYLLQKVVIPVMIKDGGYGNVTKLYKTVGWTLDSITLLLLIVFSVIIKNNTARIFLIIFAVIRFALIIGYRVFDK